MERAELIKALSTVTLCEGLSEEEVGTLADAGKVEEAYMDTALMEEGAISDSLIIVLDGEVEVFKDDDSGEETQLATVGTGAILGEVGLLESVPRTATAKAISPVRLYRLERAEFDALCRSGNPAALGLALAVARSLALRLKQMNEKVMDLLETPAMRGPNLSSVRSELAGEWSLY
ncbi:MAG: cyclic nucleotide-binding domain-containing protein [Acidobacteriota bacterium]